MKVWTDADGRKTNVLKPMWSAHVLVLECFSLCVCVLMSMLVVGSVCACVYLCLSVCCVCVSLVLFVHVRVCTFIHTF